VTTWIKLRYDNIRNLPIIILSLDAIIAYELTRSNEIIVITPGNFSFTVNQKVNPVAYQQILDYVKQTTGHDLV